MTQKATLKLSALKELETQTGKKVVSVLNAKNIQRRAIE